MSVTWNHQICHCFHSGVKRNWGTAQVSLWMHQCPVTSEMSLAPAWVIQSTNRQPLHQNSYKISSPRITTPVMSRSTTGNLITQAGWFGHGLRGLPWILQYPKAAKNKKEGKTIKSVSELGAGASEPRCANSTRQQPNCETMRSSLAVHQWATRKAHLPAHLTCQLQVALFKGRLLLKLKHKFMWASWAQVFPSMHSHLYLL